MKEKSLIALIVAVVSLTTTITGTWLGGKLTQWQWERQSIVEQKRALIEQRMKLIERASVIINSSARAQLLQQRLEIERDQALLKLNCPDRSMGRKNFSEVCDHEINMNTSQEVHLEQTKLNTEYASTFQLAALYFGPKTKKALLSLPVKTAWYEIDESSLREVLRAMVDEVGYFQA